MTRFLEDVYGQSAALRRLLPYYGGDSQRHLEAVRELLSEGERHLMFTGMGSSCYAPLAILPALTAARLEARIFEAGELLHYHLGVCDESKVLVAVSQSGESIETQRVVEEVKGRCSVVAITNNEDSYLGRTADVLLPLHAGEEGVVSTKTYTNTLAVLKLLTRCLVGGDVDEETKQLGALADDMEASMGERRADAVRAAKFLGSVPFLYFIARGPALATAHQAALTFSEGARLPAYALAGASFRHGPIELVAEEFAAVILAPAGPTWKLTTGLAREAAEEGARIVLLTDDVPGEVPATMFPLEVPAFGEDLFPITSWMSLELLLHEVANRRGLEVGIVRRISKVTRTE